MKAGPYFLLQVSKTSSPDAGTGFGACCFSTGRTASTSAPSGLVGELRGWEDGPKGDNVGETGSMALAFPFDFSCEEVRERRAKGGETLSLPSRASLSISRDLDRDSLLPEDSPAIW